LIHPEWNPGDPDVLAPSGSRGGPLPGCLDQGEPTLSPAVMASLEGLPIRHDRPQLYAPLESTAASGMSNGSSLLSPAPPDTARAGMFLGTAWEAM
jgi:hypothetical protein